MEQQRRYRLAALCPRCKRQPSTGFYPSVIAWAKTMPPEQPFATLACTKDGCHTVYRIAFVALQYAEAVGREGDEEEIRWAA